MRFFQILLLLSVVSIGHGQGCTNKAIAGPYGLGGVYKCKHYSTGYCNYSTIKAACCKCGGGNRSVPSTVPPTDVPTVSPPDAPRLAEETTSEEDDRFNVIGQNKKCPWDNTRLFSKRDKSYTRGECYDLCNNTEGCEYFSLGEDADGEERGMCMGCTADGVVGDNHSGFTFFEMKMVQTMAQETQETSTAFAARDTQETTTTTIGVRDIGRFEIRAVGTAESTTDPIAVLNAVAPRMKGTVFFEYNPETYTRIGEDPKLILYGMFQVSDEEISKPCSKAEGAVRILDSDFTQTFVKEENLEDDKKYMKLYKDSTESYPKTPSGLIGHFIFDDLDLNTADETVTDGTTVKICARVVQAFNDVTYSYLDTVFSIQRFYKGDIELTINLEPVKETMTTLRIDTSLTFNEDQSITDVENLTKAAIKAGLDARRRKMIQDEPKENVELFANRILSEQSIAATCTKRECSPNVCYDCTVSVKMVMDALEGALAKFDADNGTLDLKALFEQEIVKDTAFAGTTMVEFTNNGVIVIPDGMGLVEDTDANIINAETYLCNIINNAKLDSNSVSTPLSIGQDFKVCVKPEEQTDSLFKYQTAGFRSVSCSYTTAASGTSSETLVDANGIAPSAHTLIDTAPDADGVMGFVSMILPQYMQDTNKAIDCQGTAVIQNVRASSTRRLVEQERRSELTEGTTQSVFYEHYEEEVVGKEVPFSSTSSLGRDENKNRRELQETVQGVSFAPRIQSATDFSLGISLDSGVASTGSLRRVGRLATTLFIVVVVNAFL